MMGKFNLDDYEPVENRIKRFYEKYPDGRILTEIAKISEDFKNVVVKAYVYNNDIIVSSGYAQETQGQGFVNKDCWIENAETSAIGRALANYGFSGDKRPSREEMEKVKNNTEVKPAGNYDNAMSAIQTADKKETLKRIIGTLDLRSWDEGQKEKLLMYAQKRIDDFNNFVDKVVDTFDGEVVK